MSQVTALSSEIILRKNTDMKSFDRDLIIHTNQTFKKSKINRNISSSYSPDTLSRTGNK